MIYLIRLTSPHNKSELARILDDGSLDSGLGIYLLEKCSEKELCAFILNKVLHAFESDVKIWIYPNGGHPPEGGKYTFNISYPSGAVRGYSNFVVEACVTLANIHPVPVLEKYLTHHIKDFREYVKGD